MHKIGIGKERERREEDVGERKKEEERRVTLTLTQVYADECVCARRVEIERVERSGGGERLGCGSMFRL